MKPAHCLAVVGTPASWVTTGAALSQLAGLVASSLPDRAEVVLPEIDFTSNVFPWLVHDDRGIRVKPVPLKDLADAISRDTALVAFSAVQSADGSVADLDAIVEAAAEHDALTFVDATQACGWLPLDAKRFDFVAAAAYKWLMSPRGTAFMTVRPERLDDIRPLLAGWFAGEDIHASYYGAPLRLAKDARRLDLSPAWFSWVGTVPSLELILEIGVERIHEHNVALANRFRAGLALEPQSTAIVKVDLPGAKEKLDRANVLAATRAGSLRASFHVYCSETDVDAALEALLAG